MRRWLAVLLLAAGALTLGFGLPLLAIRLQDTRTEEDEESAEVQQVDLSDSSGLTNVEKLALMTEPDVQVMDVGVAWHQTALSLENVCENVFLMTYKGRARRPSSSPPGTGPSCSGRSA